MAANKLLNLFPAVEKVSDAVVTGGKDDRNRRTISNSPPVDTKSHPSVLNRKRKLADSYQEEVDKTKVPVPDVESSMSLEEIPRIDHQEFKRKIISILEGTSTLDKKLNLDEIPYLTLDDIPFPTDDEQASDSQVPTSEFDLDDDSCVTAFHHASDNGAAADSQLPTSDFNLDDDFWMYRFHDCLYDFPGGEDSDNGAVDNPGQLPVSANSDKYYSWMNAFREDTYDLPGGSDRNKLPNSDIREFWEDAFNEEHPYYILPADQPFDGAHVDGRQLPIYDDTWPNIYYR